LHCELAVGTFLSSQMWCSLKKRQGRNDWRLQTHKHHYSTAKILAKIPATRLAQHIDKLVSHSQSAFIKGRTIHDNFQYVKAIENHFHNAKTPMLLLKLDITKEFDNIRWEYLLEVMQHLGFEPRWRDMISLIWSTTTSRIMLNGEPGHPIKHAKGLR
jgi:hypothetical protein